MKNFIDIYKKNFRILKFLHKMDRNAIPLTLFKCSLEALYPYIGFIFMAKIIDLLLLQHWQQAILFTGIMLILQCVIGIIIDILREVFEAITMSINRKGIHELCKHNLEMDYMSLEDKEIKKEIERAELGAANNGGFGSVLGDDAEVIKALISIVISFVFIVNLCFQVNGSSNEFLNVILSTEGSLLILGILLFVMFMIYAKISKKANDQIIDLFNESIETMQESNYFINQVFMDYTKAKEIRLYRMKDMLLQFFTHRNKRMLKFNKQRNQFDHKIQFSGSLSNDILNIFVYIFVALKVFTKAISIGSFTQFVGSFQQMNLSIRTFIEKTNQVIIYNTYLIYFLDFIEQENKLCTGSLPIEKRNDNIYEIEFHNVSFHYPNTEVEVLKNVSLKITLKDKLACVGRNGAGKTTFIKLLCRLYDPSEGYITLNGIDIKKYDYLEYLQLFSVVFQDFSLFAFPLKENIACSMEEEDQKVWDCLEKAGVKEKVEGMSEQLDTLLFKYYGEEGEEISGGEAQKLAIARALYKDSPFVVLDEPTAALDPISEYEIYARFNNLVNDKTSIFISHRMSSCRFCDDIIVFDQGRIIQRGNHDTLIKDEKNVYANMWNAQSKYYA